MNYRFLAISVLLAFLMPSAVSADTWTVIELAPDQETELPYREIVFTFDDGVLELNTDLISTWPGSGITDWDLLFSGNWAVTGTVDSVGNLVSDPYATFIYDGYGGHVSWAPNTPYGYVAPLLLGAKFNDDGAATYQGYTFGEPWENPVTGMLVVSEYLGLRPQDYGRYYAQSHEFSATYTPVPEPSSLAALGFGLLPAGMLIRRRRSTNTRG